MRVLVETTATADITTEWIVELTEEQAARLQANPAIFDDLLVIEDAHVLDARITDSWNEEEREVRRVELDPSWQPACQQSFMAGSICILPEGHSGSHRSGE